MICENKKILKPYGKNTYIIENELIHIKHLNIPKIKNSIIYELIINEFKFYYKIKKKISFCYKILKSNETNFNIVVYYIDYDISNKLVENHVFNAKAVYLIQLCYVDYINHIMQYKNYIAAFLHKESLYILYCENNILKSNNIYRKFSDENCNIEDLIYNFSKTNSIDISQVQSIITCGFSIKNAEIFEDKCRDISLKTDEFRHCLDKCKEVK